MLTKSAQGANPKLRWFRRAYSYNVGHASRSEKFRKKKISASSLDKEGRLAAATTRRPDKKDACWDCLLLEERERSIKKMEHFL